ncbi:MAG: bacteriohemerythrin [Campylobacterota bacterium]
MTYCKQLEWDPAYAIGDSEIDKEHKQLFLLAEAVSKAYNNSAKLKDAVKKLIAYTKEHFANEQAYMQSIDYPDYTQHVKLHKHLVQNLQDLIKQLPTLSIDQIAEKIEDFTKNSLLMHILTEDKKIQHHCYNKQQLKKLFEFKKAYKVNLPEIDREHQQLFAISQKLLTYMQYPGMAPRIKESVKELYTYMKTHFENEEVFMQKIGYPDYENHREKHRQILSQMTAFLQNIGTMDKQTFQSRLITYIDIWLVSHIITEDQKIACYLERKKHSGIG